MGTPFLVCRKDGGNAGTEGQRAGNHVNSVLGRIQTPVAASRNQTMFTFCIGCARPFEGERREIRVTKQHPPFAWAVSHHLNATGIIVRTGTPAPWVCSLVPSCGTRMYRGNAYPCHRLTIESQAIIAWRTYIVTYASANRAIYTGQLRHDNTTDRARTTYPRTFNEKSDVLRLPDTDVDKHNCSKSSKEKSGRLTTARHRCRCTRLPQTPHVSSREPTATQRL
jgi:hypothetical protein